MHLAGKEASGFGLRARRVWLWLKLLIMDRAFQPKSALESLNPFFTTKQVGQGRGLGLDIAYRIVRRHGGDILVDSQPGNTSFTIRLPLGFSS